ncbi:MAG: hypothetical protein LLF96_04545 [Eubacteriales bacterium]|nr:hypothetical protein [Eubacteriales bacterium]
MSATDDRQSAVFSIDGSMFKRKGAWFGIFQQGNQYGDVRLWLGTCRGMAVHAPERNRMINIFPTYQDHKVPFTVTVQPAEMTIVTKYGNIRFTFADTAKLMAQGDPGVGLLLEKTMVRHETLHPRRDGAWETFFRFTTAFIFKGLEGASFDFNNGENYWNWETLASDKVMGRTHPAPDGTFTLVMEEFVYGGVVRDEYPTYTQALASMQGDWQCFITAMPAFREPFEKQRSACEYTLWSYLVSPTGRLHYPEIQMFAGVMASQWQLCQNAVALQEHIDLAVDLLLSPLDRACETGQLADMFDDISCESLMVKPPVHGWAIKQIMKHHDLLEETSRDKVEWLYRGAGAWGDWFMNHRDDDGDGLPSLFHSDETGLDDSSMFVHHNVLTTPDTAAYLVILFEAVGDLGKLLGKPEGEVSAWYRKSTALLKRLIERLWDGKRFAAMVPETGEKVNSGSIVHYVPAILGDRLPREIIDRMADDLSDPERYLSPWGLAAEDKTSDAFCVEAMSIGRGRVVPPQMLYICTGLWETHRRDTARLITENYCNGLRNSNFTFLINPLNGEGTGYFGGSWPRCAYTILGRMLSEETNGTQDS